MTPEVSVIIPVFNRERTLGPCLDSVLNQTFRDYEVVLVDNGSSDGTLRIVRRFQKRHGNLICLSEPRRGPGAARRTGELASRGEILLMTDSDCIVPGDWIARMAAPIREGKAVAVQGLKKAACRNYWTARIENEEHGRSRRRSIDGKVGLLDTANFAIRRSVLEEVGFTSPDAYYVNDTELDVRLRLKGHLPLLIEVYVAHHHPESALAFFRKIVLRGELNMMLMKSYTFDPALFDVPDWKNHLAFCMGLAGDLVRLDAGFPYHLVEGIGWRLGLFYAYLFKDKLI